MREGASTAFHAPNKRKQTLEIRSWARRNVQRAEGVTDAAFDTRTNREPRFGAESYLMKIRNLFPALALVVGAVPALASDLPTQKGPPVFSPPRPLMMGWTGFYAGVNAGGVFDANQGVNINTVPGSTAESGLLFTRQVNRSVEGFIGGGQVGYNHQLGHFVAGVEADFQGLTGGGKTPFSFGMIDPFDSRYAMSGVGEVHRSLDYLGTFRARLGYLVTPSLLLYGTGGLAYGGASLGQTHVGSTFVAQPNLALPAGTTIQNFYTNGSTSSVLTGWTAGAGAEWMFLPNWSVKGEYLYYDLGSASVRAPGVVGNYAMVALANGGNAAVPSGVSLLGGLNASTRFDGHIARAGLNYHF